jgi:hypothetical protein
MTKSTVVILPSKPFGHQSDALAAVPTDHFLEMLQTADLPELAAEANKYHDRSANAAHNALGYAWHTGMVLLAAKDKCRHGDFMSWVDAHFHGSHDLAVKYMRLAKSERVLNLDPMTSIREALKAIGPGDNVSTDKGHGGGGNSKQSDAEFAPKPESHKAVEDALDTLWNQAIDMSPEGKVRAAEDLRALADNLYTPDTIDAESTDGDAEIVPDITTVCNMIVALDQSPENALIVTEAITEWWGAWNRFMLACGKVKARDRRRQHVHRGRVRVAGT